MNENAVTHIRYACQDAEKFIPSGVAESRGMFRDNDKKFNMRFCSPLKALATVDHDTCSMISFMKWKEIDVLYYAKVIPIFLIDHL